MKLTPLPYFTFFCRKNHVDGGSVYILPDIAHGLLQFVLDRATPYQTQQMDIDKRLILDTKNSTSKKDLRLTDEAFPLPIMFEVGKFTIDGVPVMEPNTWASLRPERTDNVAKVVPTITFEDYQRAKRVRKN